MRFHVIYMFEVTSGQAHGMCYSYKKCLSTLLWDSFFIVKKVWWNGFILINFCDYHIKVLWCSLFFLERVLYGGFTQVSCELLRYGSVWFPDTMTTCIPISWLLIPFVTSGVVKIDKIAPQQLIYYIHVYTSIRYKGCTNKMKYSLNFKITDVLWCQKTDVYFFFYIFNTLLLDNNCKL